MKIIKLSTLLSCAGLVLLSMSFNASARTQKLAHAMPLDHPVHKSLSWFAKEVTKRTSMRVKVYPNLTLGNKESTLQMVQNGTLAFAKVGGGLAASFSPEYKVLSLPYLYKDEADSKRILRGPVGQEILQSSEKDGFIGLAFLSSGSRGFYTKTKITKPEDLKGLKIRVQNSPIDIDTMKALGVSPVPISSGEVYSALQQGVVDGAENNIPTYFSTRQYEVAKYYTLDQHTMIPDLLVVSSEIWNGLSKEDQATIRQIAKETLAVQDKAWDEYSDYAKGEITKNGGEIVNVDVAAFQGKVSSVYDKFKKDNPDLVQILNELQSY
ncbi:TRAP transporter substrate-binding protein [Vibrio sp. B1Z05]|uniref:TRAP transporter substrate-binding protein n=1 Tax=Vibrio sp. B1Z05 TaxID=2654980 RepID=UPI00128BF6E8|nr:TRAP transporter substrate-binding protein [Vibrio sp. B1Z05]MPW37149.1 DctP family TRAP transporter solute-binding subunit [Vibrio sp. B1Z05]